jgi:hypothetical protein
MATDPAVLLEAAFASYDNGKVPSDYERQTTSITNVEGLHVEVYRRRDSTDYIVSFRGTEMPHLDDISTDLNLGWPQYKKSRSDIINLVHGLLSKGGFVDITGHSLGGALAQFTAYDLAQEAADMGTPEKLNHIGLTTWNALGGLWGLQRENSYDPEVAANIQARHYFRGDDLISRLGKGHVGGTLLRLDDRDGRVATIKDAHMQAELKESLQAGKVSSGTPDYFPIADSSQRFVGSYLALLLKVSRGELRSQEFNTLLANIPTSHELKNIRLELDLSMLVTNALVQEVYARIERQERPPDEELRVIQATITAGWIEAHTMLDDLASAMITWWSTALAKGASFADRFGEALLDLGRQLIASQMATSGPVDPWQLWLEQERWLSGIEKTTGELPLLHSMPGLERGALQPDARLVPGRGDANPELPVGAGS